MREWLIALIREAVRAEMIDLQRNSNPAQPAAVYRYEIMSKPPEHLNPLPMNVVHSVNGVRSFEQMEEDAIRAQAEFYDKNQS